MAAVSFRSKFSGFHLENITCPVRYLRVPLGSCQSVILRRIFVLHVSPSRGEEARHTMQRCTSPCTKPRDTICSDGGQAYGMERSSAVILRVPFLSADFQFHRIGVDRSARFSRRDTTAARNLYISTLCHSLLFLFNFFPSSAPTFLFFKYNFTANKYDWTRSYFLTHGL